MLKNITLHLARSAEHPEGTTAEGYEIIAPLDAEGHLDPRGWRDARTRCLVRRFVPGEPARHGRLVHRAGGPGGGTWLIDYDDRSTDDDEVGFRLNTHVFREGEYVSIRDAFGDMQTLRVAAIS